MKEYVAIGLFGGFNLGKYRHLQDLANALEYWLAGGRDEQSKEWKRLTQRQACSVKDIPYRMERSPLLKEIITPFLHAPRDGGRTAPPELLAAGKDLKDYAIELALYPGHPRYQDAVAAWRNRWPLDALETTSHPCWREMSEAKLHKFEQEQRKKSRPPPGGIESDYTDSDDEPQPKKKKRATNPKTQGVPRGSWSSSRSSSSSRRRSQPNYAAEGERLSKKRKTTSLPKATTKASTTRLSPLVLTFPTPPPQDISTAAQGGFTFLPPLIANRAAPPTRRSSTGSEERFIFRSSMTPNQPQRPASRDTPGTSTTSGFLNPFDKPQSRRSSRLSEVISYDGMAPEIERPQEPAATPAISGEEEKRIRQDQRLQFIMTYDLPHNDQPGGSATGNMTAPQASLDKENEAQGGQAATFILEDPAKFAPRKTRGDIAVDDGTIDFSSAIIGTKDESKLSLDFATIRPDRKNPGQSIPGQRVINRYHLTVDFNDKNSVRKLNTWRKQIISRNFPDKKTKSAHAWLLKEKQLVLEMMRGHMERYRLVKWNHLTNTYNEEMAGVVQRKGEELVAQGNRKASLLKEDRTAPWRTKSALMGIKDRWPEFRDIIEAARPSVDEDENGEMEENEQIDSGDEEEEIAEPSSGSSA